MTTRFVSAIAIAIVTAVQLHAAPLGSGSSAVADQASSDTIVTGRVVDDSGNPVAGVVVMPKTDGVTAVPSDPTTDGVVTDAEGRFVIHGLAPGSYYFTAVHGRYPPGASIALPVDTDGWTELELVLEPNDYIRA